jgi:hypothetical protein
MFLAIVRYIAICAAVLTLGTTSYAFASSNTTSPNNGGDGSGVISGYTVANISYALNEANPTRIDAVSFDLSGSVTPATVKVRLVSSSSTWYACSTLPSSGGRFACATTLPHPELAQLDGVQVVATS